nr:hypothetical protein [Tanacetum cinerariifolium]
MSNMSEDIQYASFDTRLPMLDRTDYKSWQQRIRLYCLGKDNGENIMKSIVEGPYQMGTKTVTFTGGVEGGGLIIYRSGLPNNGGYGLPVNGCLYASSDTRPPMLDRTHYKSWQQCIRLYCLRKDNGETILKSIVEGPYQMGTKRVTLAGGVEGLPKDIYALINHYYTDAKLWDNVKMLLEVQDGRVAVQDVRGRYNANNQGRQFQRNNARGFVGTGNAEAQEYPQPKRPQDSDNFKDKMMLMQAHENDAVLDEERLLFLTGEQVTNFYDEVDDPPEQDLALNVDHVFETRAFEIPQMVMAQAYQRPQAPPATAAP